MSQEIIEKECAHIPCGCKARDGDDYCSDACEGNKGETDCSCGHPECHARA